MVTNGHHLLGIFSVLSTEPFDLIVSLVPTMTFYLDMYISSKTSASHVILTQHLISPPTGHTPSVWPWTRTPERTVNPAADGMGSSFPRHGQGVPAACRPYR